MTSWLNRIFRPDAAQLVLHAEPPVVTIASTSANLVIRQLTKEFTREIKEKADELDRATKQSS